MHAPTGQQFVLTRDLEVGLARVIITELAAGIREFSIDGVDLTEPFGEHQSPPMGCGIVLVPWPNRIRDGLWQLSGKPMQLDLTDPGFQQATHGLLRNTAYHVVEIADDAITLGATIYPQHGYPFVLDTTVRYALEGDGLTITHEISNRSDAAAPAAIGAHPYFRIGDVPSEQLTLTMHAATYFDLDEKLLPAAEHEVSGDFDLSSGRLLGEIDLNTTFAGIAHADGIATAKLTAPDGRTVSVWQDEDFGFVQVYTPRNFPKDGGEAMAVAIEPMTAAPDAFNSGRGLRWVQPGETWTARWGIRYSGNNEGE